MPPRSYHPRERRTRWTTESITGTSTSTPTTVASAAPDWKPNRAIAVATANSKKLLAPISAEGPATHHSTPEPAVQPVSEPGVEIDLDQDRHRQQHNDSGWRRICSPCKPNSSTSVSSSADRDRGAKARACGQAPLPALRQQHAPPELRDDHRHHDVEHDRRNSVFQGTTIEDMPSSSATIGAKATTMIGSLSAT